MALITSNTNPAIIQSEQFPKRRKKKMPKHAPKPKKKDMPMKEKMMKKDKKKMKK